MWEDILSLDFWLRICASRLLIIHTDHGSPATREQSLEIVLQFIDWCVLTSVKKIADGKASEDRFTRVLMSLICSSRIASESLGRGICASINTAFLLKLKCFCCMGDFEAPSTDLCKFPTPGPSVQVYFWLGNTLSYEMGLIQLLSLTNVLQFLGSVRLEEEHHHTCLYNNVSLGKRPGWQMHCLNEQFFAR